MELACCFLSQITEQQKDRTLYGVQDKTGEMDVLVLGNQDKIKCEKGDKLRLVFFEVSEDGEKTQLKSGPHSFFKVWKNVSTQKTTLFCVLCQKAEKRLMNRIWQRRAHM